jgi:hypothetical protein
MRYCDTDMLGSSIQDTMSAGAPASMAASRTMRAAAMVHPLARGCGQKTAKARGGGRVGAGAVLRWIERVTMPPAVGTM